MLIITENLMGGGSTTTSATLSIIIPSVGTVISSNAALLTSIAFLITNEYISNLKLPYTKLKYWINFITYLYEKTVNQSEVEKKE